MEVLWDSLCLMELGVGRRTCQKKEKQEQKPSAQGNDGNFEQKNMDFICQILSSEFTFRRKEK